MENVHKKEVEWVKDVLGNRQQRESDIHKRILSLLEELGNKDERIRTISLSGNGSFFSENSHAMDIADIVIREREIYQQQEKEIREIICKLNNELEQMNRIWICYQVLGSPAHEIIRELYVKKRLYKDVETSMGLNHRIFEESRKAAVQKIWQMYKSQLSNQDIIGMGVLHKEENDRNEKELPYEQLKLDLR